MSSFPSIWLQVREEPLLTRGGSSDAFQRREQASENYAIRQREKEKLLELKQKLAEQQQHLDRLSKHMYVPVSVSPVYIPLLTLLLVTKSPRIRVASKTKLLCTP